MSYKKNRKELIDQMLEEHGYLFCEHCGKSQSFKFHVHHIMFRSENPSHPELHNKRNLIIVSDDCHKLFHDNKSMRDSLIEERNLVELFKL